MSEAAAFFSPVFRSRRFGHRQLRASHVIKIGFVTLLGPAVVVILICLPLLLLGTRSDNEVWMVIGSFAGLAVMSPFVGIYAVPIALLLGAWAMRFGMAGWGIAVLVAALLPIGLGVIFQLLDPTSAAIGAMLILAPVVMLHGVILWCATRWICPDALLTSQTA